MVSALPRKTVPTKNAIIWKAPRVHLSSWASSQPAFYNSSEAACQLNLQSKINHRKRTWKKSRLFGRETSPLRDIDSIGTWRACWTRNWIRWAQSNKSWLWVSRSRRKWNHSFGVQGIWRVLSGMTSCLPGNSWKWAPGWNRADKAWRCPIAKNRQEHQCHTDQSSRGPFWSAGLLPLR